MKFSINQYIFNYITSSPNYIKTESITLIYRLYNDDCLGFVVPKHLGLANKRNYFKRQCRGEFQKIHADNNIKSVALVVIYFDYQQDLSTASDFVFLDPALDSQKR